MHLAASALLLSVCLGGVSAQAQEAGGCSKFKWSITREKAAFDEVGLPVLASGATLPATAATVKLQPQSGVAFASPPARKPKAAPAYAAVVLLPPVAHAGTYEVTLSTEAWIDVLQNGKEVRSSGFSGQPDCPGVRKSVRFALTPAPATIQISGAATDSVNVDVLPTE